MKVQQIREMAQSIGIRPGRTKKSDLIRAIQRKEGNPVCFDSGSSTLCGQCSCLWLEDCK